MGSELALSVSPLVLSTISQVSRHWAAIGEAPMDNAVLETAGIPRRHLLAWLAGGVGALFVSSITGFELVDHGALPGKLMLDELDGACSVATPALSFAPLGPTFSASFNSTFRNRTVGYTIAYPPGHGPGDELPLIVMLHGYGGNHSNAFVAMTPAQAAALKTNGHVLNPHAIVTVDGGNGYWNPHPDDDPMSMVVHELIPMCQRRGLGRGSDALKLMGISMGGYGALAIAQRYRGLASSVAAISPAIWTTYDEAHAANAGAFATASAFSENDVIAHASALKGVALRVASGVDDPFYPGVVAFVNASPETINAHFVKGCHTNPFFLAQEPPSLQFVSTAPTHGQ